MRLSLTVWAFLALVPRLALTCTSADVLDESNARILIVGTVQKHISTDYEGSSIFGVLVTPISAFLSGELRSRLAYELYPGGTDGDCSFHYRPVGTEVSEVYRVGNSVVIIAYASSIDEPGDLNFGSFSTIPEQCTAQEIINARPNYEKRGGVCGGLLFHAMKEISLLPDLEPGSRIDVLERLSQIEHFTKFEKLVDKYAGSTDTQSWLMQLRYDAVIDFGCESEPPIDYSANREFFSHRKFRTRWFEYCTPDRVTTARDGS